MIKADFLNTAWVIIPATGIGARAGMSTPKQYLQINNLSILYHTINIFKQAGFKNILVILNKNDKFYQTQKHVYTCIGGAERYLSISFGLDFLLKKQTDKNTWVLIHDAVRPCLAQQDLFKLIHGVFLDYDHKNNLIGGILGKPVADTLKFSKDNTIFNSVSRNDLWQALTPQMFKLGLLEQAYNNISNLSESDKKNITDDAYLIEKLGLQPSIIEAEYPNPKLTYIQDIDYIKFLLEKNIC